MYLQIFSGERSDLSGLLYLKTVKPSAAKFRLLLVYLIDSAFELELLTLP